MNTAEINPGSPLGGSSAENWQEAIPPKEAPQMPDFYPLDVVTTARGWIGTPYHHAAAVKGIGSDCTGLLIGVARELGIPVVADMTYRFGDDDLTRLEATIGEYCRQLKYTGLQDGDMLLFRGRAIFHHVAIYSKTDNTMIHVFPSAGVVSEHEYTEEWRKLLYAAYRLKGL